MQRSISFILAVLFLVVPVHAAGIYADTDTSLTLDSDITLNGSLHSGGIIHLSNGSELVIRISQQEAEQRARTELNISSCDAAHNCTMTVKEDDDQVVYEMRTYQNARLFGLFRTQMEVTAEVNAVTGDVESHRPWWAFMATTQVAT